MAFVGRIHELELLKKEYSKSRPSLIVILGRRRIGKSTLILESLRDASFAYYQASRITDIDNIALLKQTLRESFGASPILESVGDWLGIFAYLELTATQKPGITLVLDEFPYLCETNPSLPSLIQASWDRIRAAQTRLNLILCGSSIGFMEELLGERNPLRGRQTLSLDLMPMNFREVAAWVPAWAADQQIMLAATFGGMPYYLSFVNPDLSLEANLVEVVLNRGAPLFDEPDHLLQAELQTPQRYASILRAIADGCLEWGQILGRVKDIKDGSQLAPYIKKLEGLRLVEVKKSLDASDKDRNRRYDLSDPFLKFWFHFVLPNRSALESGHAKSVWEHAIEPQMSDFMGVAFERIAREHGARYGQEVFGVPAKEVGQVWAGDYDLDVAGTLLDGSHFYGECKWWKDEVGENVFERLLETSSRTGYDQRNGQTHYALYSRGGFTPGLTQRAALTPRLELISLERMLRQG
jgi:uncharacterized protein